MKKKIKIWVFSLAQRDSSTGFIRFVSPYTYFPDEFEFTFVPSFKALVSLACVPDVVILHRILYPFEEVYTGTDIYDYCIKNDLLLKDDPFEIERTGNFIPKIKGVDYKFLDTLRVSLSSTTLLSRIAKALFDWDWKLTK